jgi:beta-RFAP synthase
MTRVTAPTRLHFGLFHVPADGVAHWPTAGEPALPVRAFGGVGLMVDQPGVVVTVRPAESWQFEGMLASRAQVFAHRFAASLPEGDRRPFQVLVERVPPEHAGLGVGTQLGLAVGRALAEETGLGGLSAVELATRVGRGERSAVGVHGFDRGGLIVEPGKAPGEAVSPLLSRVQLPDEWRVVVFVPPAPGSWSGDRERQAFAAARAAPTEALCRIALLGMLPAAIAGDLDGFGDALHEFNRRAGEPFAAAQRGPYASPEAADLIAAVREYGVRGVGQSSWGPAVFAVVGSADDGAALVRQFRSRAKAVVARVSEGHTLARDAV